MILLQIFKSFFIIGLGSFGGGYVIIPMIEHQIVQGHGWITSAELAGIIAVAQMVPGIVGINTAAYTGVKTAGVLGAAAGTAGFTMPSIILCGLLIWSIARFGRVSWMEALKRSLRPAVAGLIIAAVLTFGKTSVADAPAAILAALTFAILMASRGKINPIALILCGGIAGIFIYG
jgi:chromate transporter